MPARRRTCSHAPLHQPRPRKNCHAIYPLGQPDGHRRVRVHRIRRAGPGSDGRALCANGFQADRTTPSQERAAVQARRDQLHRQRRARLFRATLRTDARAEHLRHRLPRAGCQGGLRARDLAGRMGLCRHRGSGRVEHTRHQGHRRQRDLLRRPLARQERRPAGRHRQYRLLRRRFRAAAWCRRRTGASHAGPGSDLHRPPHPQRAPRPHGRVGRLL